jgi:putative flippase GtrA
MSLASRLAQLTRFGVVGVSCAVLYASLAWSLTVMAGLPAIAASVLAYAICGVFSYLGQKLFTFRSDVPHAEAAPRFLAVFLAGISVAALAPMLLTDRMHLPPLVAIVFAGAVVPALNYVVFSLLVFGRGAAAPMR